MQTFKVHLEQTRCAEVEIQADDFGDARDKALRLMTTDQWCDGHHIEVVEIDRVMDDED